MSAVLTVQQWLAQQIVQIHSVQKCVLNQGADIVVYSWRGVIIHVHLVDEPLKVRALKRTVQEATRVGIGSLFVVDAALLPPDGARLMPADWLMAIHALSDEKVYTYRLEADGPHIGQVHFKATTRADERDVWYGPDAQIGQLPFYRIWVTMPAIKGDYLVANFAGDVFWRNPDYRNARAEAARRRHSERRGERTQYEYGYGNGAGPSVTQVQSHLERCYAELGLDPGASCEEVKAAFRKLALTFHPDVSTLPKQEAETRFRILNDAYNFIREAAECGPQL